jgi:anti-sigma factor RsiW
MKCEALVLLLPLYVEGDLDDTRIRYVVSHIRQCAQCEAIVEELRESQAMLKSLRREAVSAEVLAQVRLRAFSAGAAATDTWSVSLERILFLGLRRRAVVATAMSVVLLAAVMWQLVQRPLMVDEEPLRIAFNPPAVPVLPHLLLHQVEVPGKPANRPAKVVRRSGYTATLPIESPVTAAETESPDIVVKILTDNPNIVIYWLLDQKGGV